ncbi:MAG TPA: AraC family transcriptional regulator [Solimonas sp.]|nr:AraC family transcriptional regulator [Solimonas sp.]
MSKPQPHSHLYLWPGALMMVARAVRNQPHAHLPASLLVGLEGPLALGIAGRSFEADAALVAPNVEQSLDSRGGAVLVLHIDPDLPAYRRVAGHVAHQPGYVLPAARAAVLRTQLAASRAGFSLPAARAAMDAVVEAFVEAAPEAAPLDPRVIALVQALRDELPEKLDVAQLAAQAGLSESRLMHLFSAQMGVTLRRFILNLRLQQAIRLWRPGMALATLAAEAGFYDQPHLVRTARSLVDVLPSLFTDPRAVQVTRCS